SALGGDEGQHISRPDLIRRLGNHREERLQVIRGRQHRVQPAPPAQELQICISQRNPTPTASSPQQPLERVTRRSPPPTARAATVTEDSTRQGWSKRQGRSRA